jgi:hypothetical protein
VALPLANNGDGGTNGTAATTANTGGASGTAWDAVTLGTSVTAAFDSTVSPRTGGLSYKIVQPATAANGYLSWTTALGTLTAGQRVAGRAYLRVSALPTASWPWIRFLNGSTVLGGMRLNTAGTIQFEASGGSITGTAGTGVVATNTWYRVEFDFTAMGGTGNATGRLFPADSTTQSGTDATASAVSFGTLAANTYRLGMNGATGMPASSSYWFDDVVVNATGMPGPVVAEEVPILVMAPMR